MADFKVGDRVLVEHRTWGATQWSGPFQVKTVKQRPRVLLLEGYDLGFDHWGRSGGGGFSTVYDQLHHVTPELRKRAKLDNLRVSLQRYCQAVSACQCTLGGTPEEIKTALAALQKVCPLKEGNGA